MYAPSAMEIRDGTHCSSSSRVILGLGVIVVKVVESGKQMSEYTEDELYEGFEYLDELRDSGITNMFGAPAYMVRDLAIPKKQATDVWGLWTETFDGKTSVTERVQKALNK